MHWPWTTQEEDEGKSGASGSTDSGDIEEERGEDSSMETGQLIKSETVMLNVRQAGQDTDNQDASENIQFQITLQEDEDTEEDRDLNTGVWRRYSVHLVTCDVKMESF